MSEGRLGSFLDELVGRPEVGDTAVSLVGRGADVIARVARGGPEGVDPSRLRFDLASLTKPVIGTLALRLHRDGSLPLATEVGSVLSGLPPWLAGRSLEDLLRHRAGIAPWWPLYASPESLVEVVFAQSGPRRGSVYSDLGYLLWGQAVEAALGGGLSTILDRDLIEPLGIPDLGPPPGPEPDVVPCELDNGKEVELAARLGFEVGLERLRHQGVPQDGNARHLGGVPGHAGLFGSAEALWRLSREWLGREGPPMASEVASAVGGSSPYHLGWWPARPEGAAGETLSPRAFGMVGFTGGSWWIDPESGLVAILLLHRRDSAFDLTPWRRRFHGLAVGLVHD